MKKVKGIELMQMIIDGRIQEETEIKCTDSYNGIYVFKNKELKHKVSDVTIFNRYSLKSFLNTYFEILENDTEKIKEINTQPGNTLFTMKCYDGPTEQAEDWNFKILKDKINELVRAVNKLNKQEDSFKDINCMTD